MSEPVPPASSRESALFTAEGERLLASGGVNPPRKQHSSSATPASVPLGVKRRHSHERAGTSGSHLDVQLVSQHPARTTEPVSTFSAERPGQWALGAQLVQAPVRISPEIERTVQAIEGERKSPVRVSVRGRLLMAAAELAQKTVPAPCAAAGRDDSGAVSAMTPATQQPGCWLPLLSLRHSRSQPLHLPGLCHRGSCELSEGRHPSPT